MKFLLVVGVAALVAFGSVGCSQSKSEKPLVSEIRTEVVRDDRPSAQEGTTSEIKVTAIVDKEALLSQEFLYGADLQYSSIYEKSMDLYQQSLAIGHIPARFVIVQKGDEAELQLIADNRRLFPSDVNHPAQLISRYKILKQTDKALFIGAADSRVMLAGLANGGSESGLVDPAAKPPRDLWVRSFEFAPQGNYLLQQTSIVMDNGAVVEFMESVFPHKNLLPGADFVLHPLDPTSPTGAMGPMSERYRFLKGETLFLGETKVTFAQHFDHSKTDINPTGTIDWYVTPNIGSKSGEEYNAVRLAVEGWNRYFRKSLGRDVVRFKGHLPEGIHLGDPRYNVINWDSRRVAGAAYESQAVDPYTGKQSHSVIYMPAAWMQIGLDYWKKGQFSEPTLESVSREALALNGGIMSRARIACARDLSSAQALLASERLESSAGGADSVKIFGLKLLKGTLFHEVGHALGMAHNFKGSLSFDRSKPGSAFSTSIMDYNDYEIEVTAFDSLEGAEGPLLEYDRQVIDALYNKGAGIGAEAPILPACNDSEADEEEEGVDPLCNRYDIEKDPTLAIATAFKRVGLATLEGDVTMAQSIERVPGRLLTDDKLAATRTLDQLIELANAYVNQTVGAMQFYTVAGKASFARAVKIGTKSLLVFGEDVLEEGYDEAELRARAWQGIEWAVTFSTLAEAPLKALASSQEAALKAFERTPAMQGMSTDARERASAALSRVFAQISRIIERDSNNGLPKVRATALGALARHADVPFYLSPELDIEAKAVGLLLKGAINTQERPLVRVTAAQALLTYKGRKHGDLALKELKVGLLAEREIAFDNDSRELVELVLKALGAAGI